MVISPWKRRRQTAVEAAKDAFVAECGADLDPLMADLGFHAGHPGYSPDPDELLLFYEPEDEDFLSRYPGAGIEVIQSGGVELWAHFHRGSGQFEAHCNAGDFYMDDRDLADKQDWRLELKPVLLALADRVAEDLSRLRDVDAAHFNPRTRPPRERRGGSRLSRGAK